jgi:hypothetical protein
MARGQSHGLGMGKGSIIDHGRNHRVPQTGKLIPAFKVNIADVTGFSVRKATRQDKNGASTVPMVPEPPVHVVPMLGLPASSRSHSATEQVRRGPTSGESETDAGGGPRPASVSARVCGASTVVVTPSVEGVVRLTARWWVLAEHPAHDDAGCRAATSANPRVDALIG